MATPCYHPHPMTTKSKVPYRCSFCGKSQEQVRKLIAGQGVYICDECINLCQEIIEEEMLETPRASKAGTPRRSTSGIDPKPESASVNQATSRSPGTRSEPPKRRPNAARKSESNGERLTAAIPRSDSATSIGPMKVSARAKRSEGIGAC